MPQTTCHALVLTAPPRSGLLTPARIRDVETALAGYEILDRRELGEREAWDFLVSAPDDIDREALRRAAQAALGTLPVDVNVVDDDIAYRRKRLLVADMDSTIIEQECIDEMADVLGLKAQIAAITERAMRGELEFEQALRERLGLLAGIGEDDLQKVYLERVTLMPGARTLVRTMRTHGAYTALVSGGFTFFTTRVMERVGFDETRANILEMAEGRLTGGVVGPVLGKAAKLATLQELAARNGLAAPLTLAVGDGANDLAMIKAAGLGVAYRAKPVVAAEAHAGITHGDLTALLYLQGYRRDEFVTD